MSRPDHIVVIGGTGFIGSRVVRLHLDSGSPVTVVSRTGPGNGSRPGLTHLSGEAADERRMRAVIDGASVVYHLGMGGARTWASYERDYVHATRAIGRACGDFGVKRLVYVSSSAALYLGDRRRITEADGHDPQPETRNYYSRGKILAERELLQLHAEGGLPMTIMRPCIVVGRGGVLSHGGLGTWPADTWCIAAGDGRHPLPFVLVEDVAQALFRAAYAAGIDGQAFNLAGDVRPSAAEFIAWCAERSLRDIRLRPTRLSWLYTVALWKWMVKKAGGAGGRFPTYRDYKSSALLSDIDCSAAKRLLNWRPNADVEYFIREAIDSHLEPLHPHDLRLNPRAWGSMEA